MKIESNKRLIEAKRVDNEDIVDLINELYGTDFDPYIYNYDGGLFDRSNIQKCKVNCNPKSCYNKFLKVLSKLKVAVDDGYYDEEDPYGIRFAINKWSYIITFKNGLIILEIYLHGVSMKRWESGDY